MSRSRGWVWTLNNYTDDEEGVLQDIGTSECRYLCYGHEVGENGTPHLQGYILFKSLKTMAQVKALLQTDRVHLEIQRGTSVQAMEYCKKEDNCDFYEVGDTPKESAKAGREAERKRWSDAFTAAKEGRFDDIDADIRLRYYGTIKRIHTEEQTLPPSMETLDFWWFHGPSGSGKSRAARDENPLFYVKNLNKWWDGYKNQPCVIIEEFNPDVGKYLSSYMKVWCDHYAFQGEVKGGSICIRPPKIIVTSNYRIDDCFGPHDLSPLKRRFQERAFGGGADTFYPGVADNFTFLE